MGNVHFEGETVSRYVMEGLTNRGWILEKAFEVFKRTHNIVVALELEIGSRFRKVVIKNFAKENRGSYYFRKPKLSQAERFYQAVDWLAAADVAVPAPLMVYTERRHRSVMHDFIITEFISDCRLANRVFPDITIEIEYKERALCRMTEMVRRMHDADLVHNALDQSNFLVKKENPEEIYLLSLRRVNRPGPLKLAERMQDVAALRLCDCNLDHEHGGCLWINFLKYYDADRLSENRQLLQAILRKYPPANSPA